MHNALRFALAVALLPSVSACSLIVNRHDRQCHTDADCSKFDTGAVAQAVCQNNVCVDSGLGPKGCFSGTPTTTAEFLNACTAAQCKPFDNCARLGLCETDATLPDPVAPEANPPSTATVNPVPVPTVNCADAGPNVIYMTGAADFGPLLKAVTPLLAANSPPYRGVFQGASSCAGVNSVFDPALRIIKDIPGTPTKAANYAFYYDDTGTQVSCLLDPAGNTVDVGVSDLYSSVCNPAFEAGAAVAGYTGPVVAFTLAVPAASREEAISSEAAHLIFGLGGKNPAGKDAEPWTDPTYYFIRNSGAASTVLTALLIDVPKGQFWGIDRLSTDNLRDAMEIASVVDPAIGILSIDYADKARGNLRVLYLQAEGQDCGYLPDSTLTALDKMNVRDGHYPLWGYVHFYTPLSDTGLPSPAASALVTRFSVPRLDQALVDAIIAASLVPQCAMKVGRTTEVGDLAANVGNFQCGCYFDFATTGRTSCTACTTASDCPVAKPTCNYGYCEVN
jgi:hypothetical protein